jgi:hypothetical protein
MMKQPDYSSVLWVGVVVSMGCGSVKEKAGVLDAALPASDATASDTMTPSDVMTSAARYDVGYIDELTFGVNAVKLSSFLLVINKGGEPLKVTTASVVTSKVIDGGVDWTFAKVADATTTLGSGHAAGKLSPAAQMTLVAGLVVTEPIDDQALDFAMSFPSPPPVDVTFHAQAVIRIDDVDLTLPFTIHIVGDAGALEFNSATRLHAGSP